MNAFIFNPQAKRAKLKNKITGYLAHLDVKGEVIEIKSEDLVRKGIEEAIEKGADTIIAIGGDGLVNRIIQVLANTSTAMGIIPIGDTNFFANMLGVPDWRKGCESLVNKKIADINLGLISEEKYFTSSIEIEGKSEEKKGFLKKILSKKGSKYHPVVIHVEDGNSRFRIQTNISSVLITTVPLPIPDNFDIKRASENQKLNIVIKSKPPQENKKKEDVVSAVKGRKIEIESKSGVYIKADGEHSGKACVKIEMRNKCLKAIVAEK